MLPSASALNFLGMDVAGLDLAAFFRAGRVFYAAAFVGWAFAVARSKRRAWVWGPTALALLGWALTTFPLQRPYGLQVPSDRLRHLWWAATAAAGNPPWESGIAGQSTIEPVWSFFVSLLALRDPARVVAVYPFLPAIGLLATGAALVWAFRARPLQGALVSVFVLLAATQPLDFLEPFRMFWARHFLLKPNHALGLALVPVVIGVVSRPITARRALALAALLGLTGWVFVVDWALVCTGLAGFVALAALRRRALARGELTRLFAAVLGSAVIVAPYVLYLARHFPNAVSLSAGDNPSAPAMSPWGDERPAAHSLLFLATFDLGPHFPLAVYGAWIAWRRRSRVRLAWLGLLTAAYAAWAVTAVLYATSRARAADEVYWFLAFAVAVHAGLGAHAIVLRLAAALRQFRSAWGTPRRVAAVALVAWLPFTFGAWWDPPRTDAHFAVALEPMPAEMQRLAEWVRARTRGADLVAATPPAAAWLPALAGRRIVRLEAEPALPGVSPDVRVIVVDAPATAAPANAAEVYRGDGVSAYLMRP
jgi:hypothetical protein